MGNKQSVNLVPPETCTHCGKSIGPKQQAYLCEDAIVCSRCHREYEADKAIKENENAPATLAQLDYLRVLHLDAPAGLTKKLASHLIDGALAIEPVKHFLNGLWLREKGHHIRQYGIDQNDVKELADRICQQRPTMAKEIKELLDRYPNSASFLRHCPEHVKEEAMEFFNIHFGELYLETSDEEDADFENNW